MTCIVGIERKGKVFIGADSAGTFGNLSQRVLSDKKVFLNGNVLIGVCGLPKVMDLLHHRVKFPKQKVGTSREFVSRTLIPFIQSALEGADCLQKHNGDVSFEGALLVGYAGKLYNIESNLQIVTSAYGFDSVGSGSDIAIGSLHATVGDRNVERRILKALEASAINNAGVRPPFTILSVK